jgi:membrane protease subunit HflK
MSWNEPGKDDNPWGKPRGQQGPPDLDEIARNLQKKFGAIFGGGGGGGSTPGKGGSGKGVFFVLGLLLAAWVMGGFYKLDASERGVVLRFGANSRTTMPGLHWRPWPFETVEKVNVSSIQRFDYKTQMLTADENIVAIAMSVQFRYADIEKVLFNIRDPNQTLQDVSESAIREVVGKAMAEMVLGDGREELVVRAKELLQQTLNDYGSGIEITSLNLIDATPPSQVQAAVDDATKAREDRDRLRLEAEGYSNDILPRARGAAQRQLEEAQAYKQEIIAEAEGNASRFLALLAEYEKAPGVTRERLYLETVEEVLGNASKIIVDTDGSGNLIYLPVDKLLETRARGAGADSGSNASLDMSMQGQEAPASSSESDRRSRRAQ